jgi:protein O-mannosyl-transferase
MILVVVGWFAAWSNHFGNSFHFDDVPTIVANESVQHISNIPRFFINPRISSVKKESAVYRPLLSTWFALDSWAGGGAQAFIFQAENFLWFMAELAVMFALFRLIPGVGTVAAAFATMLLGFHPVTADTVNYALQRGVIMGAFGVISGMLIWIVWPRMLPQSLDARYLKIIHASPGLYLLPVVLALLCEPATAVFAAILLVYIFLFETKRTARDAIPAIIVCAGYWILQVVFTWKLGAFSRLPAPNYWFTQPWVAMRYLYKFVAPVHLSADTDFSAFARPWEPLAIAGYLGVAALVGLAVVTGRRIRWQAVSFGIWWFLLALLPDALIPQRIVEADWRMFLPFCGLSLSIAGLVSMALEGFKTWRPRRAIWIAAGALAAGLLVASGLATFRRSAVWKSEATLWSNAIEESPHNGRALMNYALTAKAADPVEVFDYLSRAEHESPHDPVIEINRALDYDRAGQSREAEVQFQHATHDGPAYSPAYSSYGEWLLSQNRSAEALGMASKAIALDPYDTAGRRTLMDLLSAAHQWKNLRMAANETLNLLPDDPDGTRSLRVAETGLNQLRRAESEAKRQPTVDNFLALSVLYYQSQQYEDCIVAAHAALKVNPNQAEAYANLASAYHTLGKLDETIAALQEEVRINPNLPSAKSNLDIELGVKKARSAHN